MRREKMPVCVCVCVLVYECVKKKGVAAIPLGITKIFNLPFMTPN